MTQKISILVLILLVFSFWFTGYRSEQRAEVVRQMVMDQARAWETGDAALLASLLHDDIIFVSDYVVVGVNDVDKKLAGGSASGVFDGEVDRGLAT